MSKVGQIERETQNRLVNLLQEKLGYIYLGNWEKQYNSNLVESEYLAFLASQGVAPAQEPKPASAPKATKPKGTAKPKAKGKTYTVVSGDNLTKIAKAHGTTVAELVKLNGIKDKNLINVGQVLKVG